MAECEEELHENIVKLESGMEVKDFKKNTEKMKLIFGCSTTDRVEAKG